MPAQRQKRKNRGWADCSPMSKISFQLNIQSRRFYIHWRHIEGLLGICAGYLRIVPVLKITALPEISTYPSHDINMSGYCQKLKEFQNTVENQ